MSDVADALAVLQFGDSFFPSGAVSFSWGLEGLSDSGVVTGADAVSAFVIGQLARPLGRVRSTGGRGGAPGADRASKTSPPSTLRSRCKVLAPSCAQASRRMGEAMLSVFARLGIGEASTYRERVKQGEACGHLAAMQGYLWGRAELKRA